MTPSPAHGDPDARHPSDSRSDDVPADVSGLTSLFAAGTIRPEEVFAVLAKTEGNGCVNDYTRGYTTFAYQVLLAETLGVSRDDVARRVAFVMSGGTEGVLSKPHSPPADESLEDPRVR